jgi:Predicted amidohydrolase
MPKLPLPLFGKSSRNSKDGFPISAFVDEVVKDKSYFYVATTSDVWNTCFVFSPQGEIKHYTRKVNLVPTEKIELQFSSGTYEELSVFRIPGTEVDICVAISLDAFVPRYIQELDSKGCDVLLQPDANSGAWATDGGLGYWQPLEWLGSTMGSIQTKKYIGCPNPHEALFLKTGGVKCNFQEIAINSKSIKYNVNPMMTGNLFEVSFDGQTAITGRDKRAKRDINYIGLPKLQDLTFEGKIMFEEGGFILLGPWSFDLSSLAPEEQQNKSRKLQKTLYQGGENEGKYLSTILIADLTLEHNF